MMENSSESPTSREAARQQMIKKDMENVPYTATTFSPEAISNMLLINKVIDAIKVQQVPPEQALTEIKQYLSTHTWKYIFTSGTFGELSADDSIYYVTPEGASLRLQASNLIMGIDEVVQPFREKIYFRDEKDQIILEPHVGTEVVEKTSKDFLNLQRAGTEIKEPFISRIRVYQLSPRAMPPNGGLEVHTFGEQLRPHLGHEVNQILFQ